MIYVLLEDGPDGALKIGYSKGEPSITEGLKHRLSQLQQGNPRRLAVVALAVGNKQREKELHRAFKQYRVRGEWFMNLGDVKAFTDVYRVTPLLSGYVRPEGLPRRNAQRVKAQTNTIVVVDSINEALRNRATKPKATQPRAQERERSHEPATRSSGRREFMWRGVLRRW